MAILKHIKSRNANYSNAIDYLLFQHDESTGKKIKDEMGRSLLRDEFYMNGLNCDPMSFDKECKVAASLEYWKYEDEKKEPIPLCLVDFKTLDIYSLQDYYRSVFIRDYYVEMGFEEISVEVKTFYLPKR